MDPLGPSAGGRCARGMGRRKGSRAGGRVTGGPGAGGRASDGPGAGGRGTGGPGAGGRASDGPGAGGRVGDGPGAGGRVTGGPGAGGCVTGGPGGGGDKGRLTVPRRGGRIHVYVPAGRRTRRSVTNKSKTPPTTHHRHTRTRIATSEPLAPAVAHSGPPKPSAQSHAAVAPSAACRHAPPFWQVTSAHSSSVSQRSPE